MQREKEQSSTTDFHPRQETDSRSEWIGEKVGRVRNEGRIFSSSHRHDHDHGMVLVVVAEAAAVLVVYVRNRMKERVPTEQSCVHSRTRERGILNREIAEFALVAS